MKRLEALGVTVLCDTRAEGFDAGQLRVATGEGAQKSPADKVLVTAGRAPVTQGFGLEDLGLTITGRHLDVDAQCRTLMQGVFAIGDVTGDPMLAHRAMAQGTLVVEVAAGNRASWDKRAVPAVCFTDPEIVTVGLLPDETPDSAVATFPSAGNERALTLGREDGIVRVVYDSDSALVLGIQAVGAGVSELAGAFALALEMAATLTDSADTIHAHPTFGETVQEVAMKWLGRALHIRTGLS